jgi:hypothetical protein
MTNGYLTIRFAGVNKVHFMDEVQAYRYASYEDNQKANAGQPYSLAVLPTFSTTEVVLNEVSSHNFKEGKAPRWSCLYLDEYYEVMVARFATREQAQEFADHCECGVLAVVDVRYEYAIVQAWENDHPDAYEE